ESRQRRAARCQCTEPFAQLPGIGHHPPLVGMGELRRRLAILIGPAEELAIVVLPSLEGASALLVRGPGTRPAIACHLLKSFCPSTSRGRSPATTSSVAKSVRVQSCETW